MPITPPKTIEDLTRHISQLENWVVKCRLSSLPPIHSFELFHEFCRRKGILAYDYSIYEQRKSLEKKPEIFELCRLVYSWAFAATPSLPDIHYFDLPRRSLRNAFLMRPDIHSLESFSHATENQTPCKPFDPTEKISTLEKNQIAENFFSHGISILNTNPAEAIDDFENALKYLDSIFLKSKIPSLFQQIDVPLLQTACHYFLSQLYQEPTKQMEHLKQAAEQGHPLALYQMACYLFSQEKNDVAIHYLENAAVQDYPPALLSLAKRYKETSPIKSFEYMLDAALLGSEEAIQIVAETYKEGTPWLPKDTFKAIGWYKKIVHIPGILEQIERVSLAQNIMTLEHTLKKITKSKTKNALPIEIHRLVVNCRIIVEEAPPELREALNKRLHDFLEQQAEEESAQNKQRGKDFHTIFKSSKPNILFRLYATIFNGAREPADFIKQIHFLFCSNPEQFKACCQAFIITEGPTPPPEIFFFLENLHLRRDLFEIQKDLRESIEKFLDHQRVSPLGARPASVDSDTPEEDTPLVKPSAVKSYH